MPEMVFKALLIPSFAGSGLAAVILLTRPMTKKCFGCLWHYYIWLCVLLVLLLPVRLDIRPKSETVVEKCSDTRYNLIDKYRFVERDFK